MEVMVFWVSQHIAHAVGAHTHDFYQLIYCQTGGGRITIGNNCYSAQADHVYLAPPGVNHAIENEEQMYIMEIKFLAEGRAVPVLRTLPAHYHIADIPFAREMLSLIIQEGLNQAPYYHDSANAALKLFLIQSVRKYTGAGITDARLEYSQTAILGEAAHGKAGSDTRILNLKYYISDRLCEEITLEELAAEVNFSKAFFVKRFQQLFDMTPMKYVNFMRISRAKQLLLQTELSVSTIAARTGFHSLHYFSRSFRASEGVSPQQFRAISQNSENIR